MWALARYCLVIKIYGVENLVAHDTAETSQSNEGAVNLKNLRKTGLPMSISPEHIKIYL